MSVRCWTVLRARRRKGHLPGAAERGALNILSSNAAYGVRGDFDPEETLAIFSNAIEDALAAGFNGFRAAANMSWALDLDGGAERLITYEALLRSLFSSARATGLCLYDRSRMPLAVIDGALCTHPLVRVGDGYSANTFYDSGVRALRAVDPATVTRKLEQLNVVGPPFVDSRRFNAKVDMGLNRGERQRHDEFASVPSPGASGLDGSSVKFYQTTRDRQSDAKTSNVANPAREEIEDAR